MTCQLTPIALALVLFTGCKPGKMPQYPDVVQTKANNTEQKSLAGPGMNTAAIQDTTLAFLTKALQDRKLLLAGELLTWDRSDVANSCSTLLQLSEAAGGTKTAKQWRYYRKSKTLVDVAGEVELSLAGDGITREERSKMTNLQIEYPPR